jgi:hypothetical protein
VVKIFIPSILSTTCFFLIYDRSAVILLILSSAHAARLKCKFNYHPISYYSKIYFCEVQNNGIFGDFRTKIEGIEGDHLSMKSQYNVEAIHFPKIKELHFFPKDLHVFFPNLKGIYVQACGLKEIKQSDLKHFPALEDLHIYGNPIKVIRKNLFQYNPHLRIIWLNDNEIVHIDPFSFSELKKLDTLRLFGNECSGFFEDDGFFGIRTVIKAIDEGSCKTLEIFEETEEEDDEEYEYDRGVHWWLIFACFIFIAFVIFCAFIIFTLFR